MGVTSYPAKCKIDGESMHPSPPICDKKATCYIGSFRAAESVTALACLGAKGKRRQSQRSDPLTSSEANTQRCRATVLRVSVLLTVLGTVEDETVLEFWTGRLPPPWFAMR